MAYTLTISEGSTSIDLMYSATTGWSLLAGGLKVSRPEERLIYGGQTEKKLVRRDYGKRTIPVELSLVGSTGENLIDRVNALQEMLDHAVRYEADGWGDPIWLTVKINDATYPVRFRVLHGEIETDKLYELGREEADTLDSVPVVLTCDSFWEATETYSLENYVYNPGFFRGATAPGDSWTEVDPAAALTLAWETGSPAPPVMGRCLDWSIAPDAVNDPGIYSDNITVTAGTAYYYEARGYHTIGCDRITMFVYDNIGAAIIAGTVLYFDNQDAEWEKLGVSFTTPAGCTSLRIHMYRASADSTAGNKTFYCDAFYLSTGTTAPVGWSSGRNLVNCLDGTADNINVLCVTEIPGEVEAEARYYIDLANTTAQIRVARRTRNTPADFIWELNAVDAVVTAGDASCLDSALAADVTAPGGQRVAVTFAGTQTMALRCYWDVASDLTSYYGKFVVWVIAKMEGATDTATIKVRLTDELPYLGYVTEKDISGTSWKLYDGWEVLSYRIGTADNDLIGAGNNLRLALYASTDGTPTDDLHIACVFMCPVDETLLLAEGAAELAATADVIIKDMDGDRGYFAYSNATDTYYPSLGAIGSYPRLLPEVENYLLWIGLASTNLYTFNDAYVISLSHRPRGIFLRGSNPA